MNTRAAVDLLDDDCGVGVFHEFVRLCHHLLAKLSRSKPNHLDLVHSGSEIFPSGRTTTSAERSFSRQNTMLRTSSGPITYPGGGTIAPGTAGAGTAGAGTAGTGATPFVRGVAGGVVSGAGFATDCAAAANG